MYLFLLGRDSSLSKLELSIYLEKEKINYKINKEEDNYLLIDFLGYNINSTKMITDLGGITRIANIYHTSKTIDEKLINKLDFLNKKSFNYSLSTIDIDEDEIEEVNEIIKAYFREEKAKAVYKKPKLLPVIKGKQKLVRRDIINPDNVMSWGLLKNGFELFILKIDGEYVFAKTIACSSSNDYIFKDKNRPIKKDLFSTSFRLTKIMLNILGLPSGRTIVDPFCGVGTFLIDGLIQGYDVIGIDKNNEMIAGARKNIAWAEKQFKIEGRNKLIIGDSTKVFFKADAACFEPYMGPFLDSRPNENRVRQILSEIVPLYSAVFDNLALNLKGKGRVVCVLPEFQTYDDKVIRLPEKVFLAHGFKMVSSNELSSKLHVVNPIPYNTPSGSKILRNIYILEKGVMSASELERYKSNSTDEEIYLEKRVAYNNKIATTKFAKNFKSKNMID